MDPKLLGAERHDVRLQLCSILTYIHVIQWNLFVMDSLGPAISWSFLVLHVYRGFPLSEVKMY